MAHVVQLGAGDVFAGDYRVLRPLAEGGMGAVYVVEQLSTGVQRALKIMHPDLLVAQDPAAAARNRERFANEARVSGRIESEHVVQVLAAGVDERTSAPWLVMELLHGQDLRSYLAERGRLDAREVLEIFEALGHALGEAHRVGIVHLDLKPENVFLAEAKGVNRSRVVKVLDFGIAKIVQDHRRSATVTTAMGSPLWLAPEQTQKGEHVGPWTDVWALGLIAYRLLTGMHYWKEGNGPVEDFSITAWLLELVVSPLVPASERAAEQGVAAHLPEGFDEWFGHCVVREREARFEDAQSMMVALRGILAPGDVTQPEVSTATQGKRVAASPAHLESAPQGSGDMTATVVGPVPVARGPTEMPSTVVGAGPFAPTIAAGGLPPTNASTKQVRPTDNDASASIAGRTRALTVRRAAFVTVPMLTAAVVLGLMWKARRPSPPDPGSNRFPDPRKAETDSQLVQPTQLEDAALTESRVLQNCPAEMVQIPEADFQMGGTSGDEQPVHWVHLSAYCIDRTEVTVAAYQECALAAACPAAPTTSVGGSMDAAARKYWDRYCNGSRSDRANHPVNCVDWSQAAGYCHWRGARLPTEAEWEYAARGSDGRRFPWGNEPPSPTLVNGCGTECRAIYPNWENYDQFDLLYRKSDGWPTTAPVGTFARGASPFGLLDMAGNVQEWVSDWYGPYPQGDGTETDPTGPVTGTARVFRGGFWMSAVANEISTTARGMNYPDFRMSIAGFRCAKSLPR